MKATLLTLLVVYSIGAGFVFMVHMFLPMVTLPLVVARSLVWPIWLYNGWPHGAPLPMD